MKGVETGVCQKR